VRELPGVDLLEVGLDAGELPLWVVVVCKERDAIREGLAARGIEAKAFHPCLGESAHLGAGGKYPNAEHFARAGLTLPSGPDQSVDDLQEVVAALREIVAGSR
jgi:dTDP-4-amino-4,6-dideoxygalactose transaminase